MPHLFLDCDGVLADFDEGVRRALGTAPEQYRAAHGGNAFWRDLGREAPHIYRDLPPTSNGRKLYRALRKYRPTILTGAHFKSDPDRVAVRDKELWCAYYFPGVEVVCCRSEDKRDHMHEEGDILVDDRLKYAHLWTEAGGVFIHHDDATWRKTVEAVERLMRNGK